MNYNREYELIIPFHSELLNIKQYNDDFWFYANGVDSLLDTIFTFIVTIKDVSHEVNYVDYLYDNNLDEEFSEMCYNDLYFTLRKYDRPMEHPDEDHLLLDQIVIFVFNLVRDIINSYLSNIALNDIEGIYIDSESNLRIIVKNDY